MVYVAHHIIIFTACSTRCCAELEYAYICLCNKAHCHWAPFHSIGSMSLVKHAAQRLPTFVRYHPHGTRAQRQRVHAWYLLIGSADARHASAFEAASATGALDNSINNADG